MPSCIITGATGYIGSHVAKYLLNLGWEVSIISQPEFGYINIESFKSRLNIFEYDGNINSLIQFFNQTEADVVMHLAAAVITNYRPEQIPSLIRSNIEFGTEILESMRWSKTRLFIGTGSYWQNFNSDTYNPVDLYAATKEAFEKIVQYYVDAFGLRAITLRLFDVYGEDDKRPKLLNILRKRAETGEVTAVSPGGQILDMVHIDDVSRAYERAYEYLRSHEDLINGIYGVFSGETHSLKEIIQIYEQTSGRTFHLDWGAKPYKDREVMKPYNGYVKLPNWEPSINLIEGFQRFV